MTVRFLTSMLTADTIVTIKDIKTRKTLYEGKASKADFADKVIDWDFSKKHIIYI